VILVASLYEWLLFLHVVAAMVWVGGTALTSVLATIVARRQDRRAVEQFVSNLSTVGPLVMAPATLGVVGFGIWLVLDSDAWDFGQTWVWLALVLFAGAFVVGAAFQSRSAIAARRAADAGDDAEASRQLARWAWGSRAILILLVVAAWDMVFKPGI
jgi:uncharacterized membrane protein